MASATQSSSSGLARLPDPPARVHFVGIGGIGMSGLARILHAWGHEVTGSDLTPSELTQQLEAEGISIVIGHDDPTLAREAALVVMTAAVRGENAEISAARDADIPIIKRAALLGLLADVRRGVAVAGSHGKSTTSGMLTMALRELGMDPSYAIGAVIAATGANAAPGDGAEMVVEADEYDYSFLTLHPDVAIITNIDYDHPDLFPDQESYDEAFSRFVGNVRPGGTLIIAGDDPGCARLLERIDLLRDQPARAVVIYGEGIISDWRLIETADGWGAIGPSGQIIPVPLQVPGRHNARNAIAVLAALIALGHAPERAAAAIGAYTGISRRFELKGEVAGVTVIDDYAHHPVEIAATLAAARVRFPARRIWAVFQPHTYTRTHAMLAEFAAVLTATDQIMLLDIYAAREVDTLGLSARDLADRLPGALVASGPRTAAEALVERVAPGDVVLTMGAGDITECGPALLDLLDAWNPPRLDMSAPDRPAPPTAPAGDTQSARQEHRAATRPIVTDEKIPDRPHLKVLRDSRMSMHTTWRIGGSADWLVRVGSPYDLIAVVRWGHARDLPLTVIGGGSNVLVGDGGIRGLVILSRTPGERAEHLVTADDHGDHVILRVGAQAPLSWTGRYAAERGWMGLDWGVGLPGTIGGATVNNAGAHGTELKDHLLHVEVLGHDGEVREETVEWFDASYRMTRIKRDTRPRADVVIASVFRLPKGDRAELVRLAEAHARFRKETQPTGATAGSTFANPPGDFAGRLLEEAGLKGFGFGGARFSEKHANWIVNEGGATAADVRALINHARQEIRARFGVSLRAEVEPIGED